MTDPAEQRRTAIALTYNEGAHAPKVVAKGRGILAEAIIQHAKDAGVYVHESPALVSLLMQVDMDQYIPPELYMAVAELLAWLYQIEHGGLAVAAPSPLMPGSKKV